MGEAVEGGFDDVVVDVDVADVEAVEDDVPSASAVIGADNSSPAAAVSAASRTHDFIIVTPYRHGPSPQAVRNGQSNHMDGAQKEMLQAPTAC